MSTVGVWAAIIGITLLLLAIPRGFFAGLFWLVVIADLSGSFALVALV